MLIRCALVRGDIVLDDHEIAPTFGFHQGKIDGEVSLLGTKLKRSLSLRGSTVTGMLNADRSEVGGGLFLRDGGTFADIGLLGAKIGGIVQLVGSTFGGEIDLTGAAIGSELHLSSGWLERSPTWQNGASLILRNAKADVLQARADSWNVSGGYGLLPTDLTGFTFNRLGGLDTSGGASMGDESADWLVGWIEAQRGHGENSDPQPYTQLAQVLESAGATDRAEEIRFAKFDHRHDYDNSVSMIRRICLTLERYVVGYGVYPFRTLYWFVGLVVFGGLFAQCSKERSVRLWGVLRGASQGPGGLPGEVRIAASRGIPPHVSTRTSAAAFAAISGRTRPRGRPRNGCIQR